MASAVISVCSCTMVFQDALKIFVVFFHCHVAKKETRTKTVKYMTGKSFVFISLNKLLNSTFFCVRRSQSLLFSTVACNTKPAAFSTKVTCQLWHSMRSKRFRPSWSTKLGREQKREWRGRARGMKETLARKPHDFEKQRSPTNAVSDWRSAGSVDYLALETSIKPGMLAGLRIWLEKIDYLLEITST